MRRASLVRRVLSTVMVVCLVAIVPVSPAVGAAAIPGSWSVTDSLDQARGFAPAVTLGDGSVITAGGTDGSSFTATAERYSGGSWSSAGAIGQAVAGQVAAPLPGGKALFAGGADDSSYYMHGDVFDPGTGHWTQTPAMVHAHAYGAAASLSNGDVVVVGGYDGGPSYLTGGVDIYSALGGTWSAGPALPSGGRYAFTAASMAGSRVLVAGGNDGSLSPTSALKSAYVFTPGVGWAAAESMSRTRVDAASIELPDGRVLVAGGTDASGVATNTAEVYDPSTGHWTLTGYMIAARAGFTLTQMSDGYILAAGGYASGPTDALNSAELFDPTTGGWSGTGSLMLGRRYHSAAALGDGSVLVMGGHDKASAFTSWSELFAPPAAPATYPSTTFHAVVPSRIFDTRVGNGGWLYNRTPRRFQVAGKGGVPVGAIAVTGILTTTQSTALGYLALGPVYTSAPGFSTLNFSQKDNRANNVAVALDGDGYLSVVYVGAGRTHAILDITGYFTADDTGATYYPVDPGRIMDSRYGVGVGGKFKTGVARAFQVTGLFGVPSDAIAVTGNLTAVNATVKGWAYVGPSIPADPKSLNCSTINAVPGDTRADGVTVKLGSGGTLSAVWVGTSGSTTDLIFDVTGYFVAGTAGSKFVPLDPIRLIDTRVNLPLLGPVGKASPIKIQVAGRARVPGSATGISGNLTVTQQTYLGYLAVAPHLDPGVTPGFSTLNFPVNDNRANGFYIRLYSDGTIAIVYEATKAGSSTHIVLDVTGYFEPAP